VLWGTGLRTRGLWGRPGREDGELKPAWTGNWDRPGWRRGRGNWRRRRDPGIRSWQRQRVTGNTSRPSRRRAMGYRGRPSRRQATGYRGQATSRRVAGNMGRQRRRVAGNIGWQRRRVLGIGSRQRRRVPGIGGQQPQTAALLVWVLSFQVLFSSRWPHVGLQCNGFQAATRGLPPKAPRSRQQRGIREHALFNSLSTADSASAHSPPSILNCSFYESRFGC